ncbi:MAG: phosphatidate cytidylyltransferase [Coriobacteriia bacterium]
MPGRLRDLGIRTGTALLLGGTILIALLWGGVWALAAVISAVALMATMEFYGMTRRERRLPSELIGLAAVGAMPFAAALHGAVGLTAVVGLLVISAFFWHVMIRQIRLAETGTTLFGAVYIGFTLAHVVLIREFEAGTMLALTMIVSIWVNDSFAYVAGTALGRHRLAPRISPRKSWEGLVAGTVGTTAVWTASTLLPGVDLPVGWRIAIGLAASLAAVIGDLAESRIKREVGVKDSGSLLPGHGGYLDRFDSFIMVAIVTHYMLFAAGVR